MGLAFWEQLASSRVELSDGNFLSVTALLQVQINKAAFDQLVDIDSDAPNAGNKLQKFYHAKDGQNSNDAYHMMERHQANAQAGTVADRRNKNNIVVVKVGREFQHPLSRASPVLSPVLFPFPPIPHLLTQPALPPLSPPLQAAKATSAASAFAEAGAGGVGKAARAGLAHERRHSKAPAHDKAAVAVAEVQVGVSRKSRFEWTLELKGQARCQRH